MFWAKVVGEKGVEGSVTAVSHIIHQIYRHISGKFHHHLSASAAGGANIFGAYGDSLEALAASGNHLEYGRSPTNGAPANGR